MAILIFFNRSFFSLILAMGLTGLLVSSCSDPKFSPSKQEDENSSPSIEVNQNKTCSDFTLIKPDVDFLFIWDNSTSTYFINDQTKEALNNTIDMVSSRFDYHIMVAPLIGSGNDNAFFISENPDGLSSSVINNLKVDRSLASKKLGQLPSASGSSEDGFGRAVELIENNMNNGIFRENAYTMVVLMSNEDQSYYPGSEDDTIMDPEKEKDYRNEKLNELLCLRGKHVEDCNGSGLSSQQMRFMTIVPHSTPGDPGCRNIFSGSAASSYVTMSESVYNAPYSDNRGTPSDQTGNSTPDSYDLCQISDFTHIFDGINNTIQDQVIKHKYNYWPVASPGADAIDPNEVTVQKSNGVNYPRLSEPVTGSPDGFTFENSVKTVDTRYEPTSGEPYTGYVVRLYGDARVAYPECMTVTTQTPKEYFGYAQMDSKPKEGTITVKINGNTIPQGGSNGWQLIEESGEPKYFDSKNIKIEGPGGNNNVDYTPATPGLFKSGYFVRLNGDAVYTNGANVNITYLPDGN